MLWRCEFIPLKIALHHHNRNNSLPSSKCSVVYVIILELPETRLVPISIRAISMHKIESRESSNRKYLSKTILACCERQAKHKGVLPESAVRKTTAIRPCATPRTRASWANSGTWQHMMCILILQDSYFGTFSIKMLFWQFWECCALEEDSFWLIWEYWKLKLDFDWFKILIYWRHLDWF